MSERVNDGDRDVELERLMHRHASGVLTDDERARLVETLVQSRSARSRFDEFCEQLDALVDRRSFGHVPPALFAGWTRRRDGLSREMHDAVSRHLARCGECRELADRLGVDVAAAEPVAPARQPGFFDRIRSAFLRWTPRAPSRRWSAGLAVASLAMAAIVLVDRDDVPDELPIVTPTRTRGGDAALTLSPDDPRFAVVVRVPVTLEPADEISASVRFGERLLTTRSGAAGELAGRALIVEYVGPGEYALEISRDQDVLSRYTFTARSE